MCTGESISYKSQLNTKILSNGKYGLNTTSLNTTIEIRAVVRAVVVKAVRSAFSEIVYSYI